MAHIVILEDDPDFGAILEESLALAGHNPHLFIDAYKALDFLQAHAVPLAIVDIIIKKDGMPVPAGGVLFTHRAKDWSRSRGQPLAIIAISGSVILPGMENILEVAKQVGADAALAKPFSPDTLLAQVSTQLERLNA